MSNTVYVLGAGASCMANLPGASEAKLPDVKHFVGVGRSLQLRGDYTPLWRFLEDRYNHQPERLDQGEPDLEQVFSSLDVLSSALWFGRREELIRDIGHDFEFVTPRDYLLSFIVETIQHLCASLSHATCPYHDEWARELDPGDTVISFNYDLIADASLKRAGKWSERGGYGLPTSSQDDGHSSTAGGPPMPLMLKLHGSINWLLQSKSPPFPPSDREHSSGLVLSRRPDAPEQDEERARLTAALRGALPGDILLPILMVEVLPVEEALQRDSFLLPADHAREIKRMLSTATNREYAWALVSGVAPRLESLGKTPFLVPPSRLKGGTLSASFPALRACLLYTSPSPRDRTRSRMPSSA